MEQFGTVKIFALIELVKKYKQLYNGSSKLPGKRDSVAYAWSQVAEQFGDKTAEDCKACWRSLRIRYLALLNREDQTSAAAWPYFKALFFLGPYIQKRRAADGDLLVTDAYANEVQLGMEYGGYNSTGSGSHSACIVTSEVNSALPFSDSSSSYNPVKASGDSAYVIDIEAEDKAEAFLHYRSDATKNTSKYSEQLQSNTEDCVQYSVNHGSSDSSSNCQQNKRSLMFEEAPTPSASKRRHCSVLAGTSQSSLISSSNNEADLQLVEAEDMYFRSLCCRFKELPREVQCRVRFEIEQVMYNAVTSSLKD